MGRLLGIAVLSLALAAAEAQQVLKKNCEIGVGFSFAALSVFRLRRAEAASAVWIPHWHSEPFESQGARAAKRYVKGEPRRTGEGAPKPAPKPRTARCTDRLAQIR